MTFTNNSDHSADEKLLILGCGDLGQRLATELESKPYQITGVRRSPATDQGKLQYRQLDLHHGDQLNQLCREPWDVLVITLTPSERSDQGYKRTYVDTCAQLTAALKANGARPRLILFVSSTGVYGQNDGSWVDELSPTQPDSFSGRRLLEAEAIIAQSGFPYCIVRFSGIYGPGRRRLIDQVRQGQAPGGTGFTNRIHAWDCARCLAHLLERQKIQPLDSLYLASDSNPSPMNEVTQWLAQQMGVNTTVANDPAKFNGSPGERSNKRICNRRLLDAGFQLLYPDFRLGYAELLEQPPRQDKTQV